MTPRYDQITLNKADRKNKLQQILSPNQNDAGVWIYQDAWFNLTDLDAGKTVNYRMNKAENGLYIFVLEGSIKINEQQLDRRDALGIIDATELEISALEDAYVLLMEVPMDLA